MKQKQFKGSTDLPAQIQRNQGIYTQLPAKKKPGSDGRNISGNGSSGRFKRYTFTRQNRRKPVQKVVNPRQKQIIRLVPRSNDLPVRVNRPGFKNHRIEPLEQQNVLRMIPPECVGIQKCISGIRQRQARLPIFHCKTNPVIEDSNISGNCPTGCFKRYAFTRQI